MTKQVYVVIAFHAHEPLWDLPSHILKNVDDEEMKSSVQSMNWVKKRVKEGRDIYANLIDFAKRLGAPVALEATNEILVQLAQVEPATFERLSEAYQSGIIYPIYGNAHHTHVLLLSKGELVDEIRLNREFVHNVLKAPEPKYRGFFPSEDSLDASKLDAVKTSGIDFVIFPHLDRKKTSFRALGVDDYTFGPFTIGDGIIALPRHFNVSQDIWRPITRMEPENLTGQGYLLGDYWVFPEEYRRKRFVPFPIDYPEAVAEYRRILEDAIDAAPDGGLLLYIQDLELMDFGDVALAIMGDAWEQVRSTDRARIQFVNPDEYLDRMVFKPARKLGRVKFHQVSWAPEIRLVLRSDGHYPPLGAGRFEGIDSDREIFRRWPFIFWEAGRYVTRVCSWLLQAFGFPLEIGETAEHLKDKNYRLYSLSLPSRLALHLRLMKRACNWGWQPDESRHKWPYLHAYAIIDELAPYLGDEEVVKRVHENLPQFPVDSLKGLSRLPEVIVDTRAAYLRKGLRAQEEEWRMPLDRAFTDLDRAMDWRREAVEHLARTRQALQEAQRTRGDAQHSLALALDELKAHCKAMFMAIDYLQRAWGQVPSVEDMVISMYHFLHEIYPPRLPDILRDTLTEAEAEAVLRPKLL